MRFTIKDVFKVLWMQFKAPFAKKRQLKEIRFHELPEDTKKKLEKIKEAIRQNQIK